MYDSPPELQGSTQEPTVLGAASIPREDWDRAPWNRWSFQHVRELVPTAQVWRGPGPATALPVALQDIDGVAFESDGQPATVGSFFEANYADGFLVLHRGRVVAERYFNGMTSHSQHLSQSVAKSVVGTVAGILIGRGVLDPAAPVTFYLPELEATAYRGATVQQVLDMTTGVVFDETYTALDSHIAKMDVASGWKARKDPSWPTHVFELILQLQASQSVHGAIFNYRSVETDVLAFVLQSATGLLLPELVSRELWAPMGAEEDAYFTVDPAGYGLADGGFNATLRDYARFALLHLGGGEIGGRRLLPSSWLEDTRFAARPDLFQGVYRDILPRGAYRNQFWIEDVSRSVIMCRGVFGQLIYIDAAHGLVVVKLSSWPDFLNLELGIDTLRMVHALASEIT